MINSIEYKMVSVIIPMFNEAATIAVVLHSVVSVELSKQLQIEIIVVDDHSSDNSVAKANEFVLHHPNHNIRLLRHAVNKGKGACLHTGIKEAKGDFILIQDADSEYNPEQYNLLLKPLLDGVADVVYSSRFLSLHPRRVLFFWHSIGNKVLTGLSNVCTNLNLSDMESGYKVFKSDIIHKISLKEQRFGFEPEVTAKISRIPGIRIYEVGISYYGRTYKEGKKIGWKDGFRAIYCIIKYGLLRIK